MLTPPPKIKTSQIVYDIWPVSFYLLGDHAPTENFHSGNRLKGKLADPRGLTMSALLLIAHLTLTLNS